MPLVLSASPTLLTASICAAVRMSTRCSWELAYTRLKARSIISLFMHGGPSQVDLFDHKPKLREWHGQELPASVRGTQRLTGMTSGQASLPVTASAFRFAWRINATLLDRLGFDHTRLTFRFQGRDYRLTDVHGEIVHALLA